MTKRAASNKGGLLGPALGITALAGVQIAVVGIALWPALFTEDDFLSFERVTVIDRYDYPADRWLVRLDDGNELPMPPPASLAYAQGALICIRLTEGVYGSRKARLATPDECAD